jgi:hypothetical protein
MFTVKPEELSLQNLDRQKQQKNERDFFFCIRRVIRIGKLLDGC